MKMQRGFGSVLKVLLLSTTLLAGTTGAQADLDDGDLDNTGQAPLPSGQFITPTFATGSAFSVLSPDIPEYTPAIGNYPNFRPGGAIASTLSPDGKTLAVMTSGYNVLDDARGNLVGTGAEFVILYDVSNPRAPRQKQTLRPPNTFVGLAFSPDGSTLYVSGGNDDQVLIYKQANGTFAQSGTIPLGHNKIGIGISQYPQTGGVAVSPDGSLLAVANTLNNSVSVFSTADNTKLFEYDLRPFNTTPGSDGAVGGNTIYSVAIKGNSTLYATSLRDREVVVVDISGGSPKLITRIPLPGSPNNLVLNKAQDTLFVSQDNSDNVAVISTASNTIVEQIDAIAPPGVLADKSGRYTGAATNNVALSPDQKTLFVTNGGANDVAIIPLKGGAPHQVAGLIPTGWYPTTVTVSADCGTLYVFNNKSDPGPNPGHITSSVAYQTTVQYPGGNTPALSYAPNQYILQLQQSGMLTVPVPGPGDLSNLTTQVAANNGWSIAADKQDEETMAFLRSHIRHVIYIVKENRTFDQVLGDLTNGANGDPSITVFGKAITPNFHRIANSFVTLDNFFDSGEVSGNGWPWSTAARETDWNEKNIPMDYSFGVTRYNAPYDAEGQNNNVSVGYVGDTPAATVAAREAEAGGYDFQAVAGKLPGGALNLLPGPGDSGAPDGKNHAVQSGYIWSAALRAGLTVRNYGFLSDNSHYGLSSGDPGYAPVTETPAADGARQMWTAAHELIPYTDIYFRGFDNAYPDAWRLEEFAREFNAFAQPGNDLPQLVLLRYMHDHMGSFSTAVAGLTTAETQQADNDYAVGATLELLARSRFAQDTLVFVLEDDAQDGGDHMDAHRSTAYVVGPYVRNHAVVSTRYSTVNMVRTIEDVLGLEHLNLNTAYQRPMSDVFDIGQSPEWRYRATASAILKSSTLNLTLATPEGQHAIEFAEGPDMKPLHDAAWWTAQTRGFDWSSEDRVPADMFNRIVWDGVIGGRPYPEQRSGIVMRTPATGDDGQDRKAIAQ
nr:beta-propeller fold lactonase family protein [uncultured Rhodopila sp.]